MEEDEVTDTDEGNFDDFASVRNSTGFVDAVPIMDLEPPIGDNVCPTIIINFWMIYLQCPIDRTIKQLKVAVEMKPA